MSKLMLLDNVDALCRKLNGSQGSLAEKWRHFQVLAEHQAESFPLNPALVALVTGDERAARRFRELLEKRLLQVPADCRSHAAQYHTWCWSIPLGRWAVAYDWLADSPAFKDFDHAAAADVLIDAIHSQVYPRILARQPAGDNQIGSMLLACGLIGYLFGVKRGSDPRAQRLYQIAMERGAEIAATAHAQFIGEGSVYMTGVNVVVMGLWYEFLRWLDKPFDRAKWLSCQQAGRNMISPAGLTLPWDAGGNFRAFDMVALALLARETHDAAPLALMDHLNMWHGIDHCAWFEDQRLWTLVWWPENAPAWPAREIPADKVFDGWMHPEIGGCLDTPVNRMRFAQLWDICGGGQIGGVARPHTDPNTLILEVNGSPLFLDGMPTGECRAFEYPEEKILSDAERDVLQREIALFASVVQQKVSLSDRIRGFAHGCIGGSNALVLNGEPWYYPRKDVWGRGTLWAQLPGLRAVAADCTEHYTPHYPVRRIERTSLMIRDRYLLVLDEIAADAPVGVSWQVHVRPEQVERTAAGAVVNTPEGPWAQILPETPAALKVEPVPGYPKDPVGGSVRVSWQRELQAGTMATLIVPGDDEVIAGATAAWSGGFAEIDPEHPESLPDGLRLPLSGAGTPSSRSSSSLAKDFRDEGVPAPEKALPRLGDLPEAVDAESLDVLLAALAAAPATRTRWLRCRLKVPAGADYFRITVINPNAGIWWNGQCIRPVNPAAPGTWGKALPIALPAPASGEAELILVTRPDKGLLQTDDGLWYRRMPRPEVQFKAVAGGWEICEGATVLTVCAGAAAQMAGWQTDARWLVTANDGWAAVLAATRATGPGVNPLSAQAVCHAVWNGAVWAAQAAALPPVAATLPAKPMPLGALPAAVPLAPADSAGRRVCAAVTDRELAPLVALLDDADWRVQRAAVERIGELGDPAGAAPLRRLLEAELGRALYPEMTGLVPTGTLAQEFAAIGTDTGSKRFRLVQALILALRWLGDRQALGLVRRALENENHFYPVYCAGVDFLAEFGEPEDRARLEFWSSYPECNTKAAARLALNKWGNGSGVCH